MGASSASTGAEQYIVGLIDEAVRVRQPIAIDSTGLISFLFNERSIAALIDSLLSHPGAPKIIWTISLAEMTAIADDHQTIAAVQRDFNEIPNLTIVDFDQRHAIEAAYVRAATGLRLPDAAIVVTARLAEASALIAASGSGAASRSASPTTTWTIS